jgi:DNA-binding transcriptional MerR regulator
MTPTWKVGPLAEASGLTVKTLHHWDTIGLLSPSQRSSAGHRVYTGEDLVRLYQILALRRLGLGLESIGTCLDAGVDPTRVLADHLADVEKSLAELTALRDRLRQATGEAPPSTAELLEVIRSTRANNEVLQRHLDQDQINVLANRAAALGPAAHYLLEIEWPELYRRAAVLHASGVAIDAPEIRRVVARMDELSVLFSGGDAEISGGVKAAWRDDPAAMSGEPDPPADEWRELSDYLNLVRERLVR